MSNDTYNVINDFMTNEQKGLSINSLIKNMCFFEVVYSTLIEKSCMTSKPQNHTIYESELIKNFFRTAYFNSQANNIGKLIDHVKENNTRSLYILWNKIKDQIPPKKENNKIKSYFEDIKNSRHEDTYRLVNDSKIKNFIIFRNKLACHNDTKLDSASSFVDIQHMVKIIIEIYTYFNSLIPNNEDVFNLFKDWSLIENELKILKRPFIQTIQDEDEFIKKWREGLSNLGLTLPSKSKFIEEYTGLTVKMQRL